MRCQLHIACGRFATLIEQKFSDWHLGAAVYRKAGVTRRQ